MPLPDVPVGIQNQIDTQMETLRDNLAAGQTAYLASNSKYWQGILFSAVPADGGVATPDKSKKPTDQSESWNDFGVIIPASPKCAMAVDVYDGPDGKGYVIRGHIKIAGQEWYRVRHAVGPETWREMDDWKEIVEP